MPERLFTSVIQAKNSMTVPVFKSGKSMHSRYDPEREAFQFAESINFSSIFLIAGFGGGYHIKALLEKFPNSIILAAENSSADIEFLRRNIPAAEEMFSSEQVIVFPIEMTAFYIKQYYLPVIHGSLKIMEQRSWAQENPSGLASIRHQAEIAVKAVSADYSVQAHFGRIWQHNIISNLKNAERDTEIQIPVNKTAVIAAAGPSLDSAAEWIRENRNNLYVIAADTAYGSLQRHGIFCDAAVSIDGQQISHAHFIQKSNKKTLFIFDLCANSSAVRKIQKEGCSIIFAQTGHPLCRYADSISASENFIQLESGAGTVAIAAADFALKAGFSNIAVAGADFSYINGKPYAKGTYLDDLYSIGQNRLFPSENAYCSLMFRTPIIRKENENRFSTAVLDSYSSTFSDWLLKHGIKSRKEKDIIYCTKKTETAHNEQLKILRFEKFNFRQFQEKLIEDYNYIKNLTEIKIPYPPAAVTAFPYAAYLRNKEQKNQKEQGFVSILKLAFSAIVQYTKKI